VCLRVSVIPNDHVKSSRDPVLCTARTLGGGSLTDVVDDDLRASTRVIGVYTTQHPIQSMDESNPCPTLASLAVVTEYYIVVVSAHFVVTQLTVLYLSSFR